MISQSVSDSLNPIANPPLPTKLDSLSIEKLEIAFFSESLRLITEGLPIDSVDAAWKKGGYQWGPLESMDQRGLDHLPSSLQNHPHIENLKRFGLIGKRNRNGFYNYGRFRTRPNELAQMILWQLIDLTQPREYIFHLGKSLQSGMERIQFALINQIFALNPHPGVIPSLEEALQNLLHPNDAAVLFLKQIDELGFDRVIHRLEYLAKRFGSRFEPCAELFLRRNRGERFYAEAENRSSRGFSAWRLAG